jgi:phage baseplate assembly protein W
MRQFAIQDGDLVLSRGGFALVSGQAKVKQDLGCALREPIGTDRFHPGYGSLLAGFIGQAITRETSAMIEAEVYRVVKNYMLTRMAVIQDDFTNGRKPLYEAAEIIQNIDEVRLRQEADRFYVLVRLSTLARERVTIITTVEAT